MSGGRVELGSRRRVHFLQEVTDDGVEQVGKDQALDRFVRGQLFDDGGHDRVETADVEVVRERTSLDAELVGQADNQALSLGGCQFTVPGSQDCERSFDVGFSIGHRPLPFRVAPVATLWRYYNLWARA